MQVGGVKEQGVITDGNDEPAEFASPGLVTWDGPVGGWGWVGLTEYTSNYPPEKCAEKGDAEGVAAP